MDDDLKAVVERVEGFCGATENGGVAEWGLYDPVPDLRTLLSALRQRDEALTNLLDHVDRETCTHEDTHRGGAIWTICDGCGRKWADDEGGFQPHADAPGVAAARAILTGSETNAR